MTPKIASKIRAFVTWRVALCVSAMAVSLVVANNCGAPFSALNVNGLGSGSGSNGSGSGLGSIPQSPTKTPYGLNIDFNLQSFADMFQPNTTFNGIAGATITGDSQGWPQQDFEYFLDNRYTLAWVSGAVNVDPQHFSVDLSGNYTLVFNGQANVTAWGGPTISNQVYNPSTNTTTATVTIPTVQIGTLMCGIDFKSTKRNPNDAPGNGLTNVHLYRPGYGPTSASTFTEPWLHQIRDFQWTALRFMGVLGTGEYGQAGTNEAYPYMLSWNDRMMPGRSGLYAQTHPGNHGIPWEYVVEAANETNRDPWINVPVNASDAYVQSLAQFLHDKVHSSAVIYVEYSNEMWHDGFPQGPWMQQAATAEVNAGNSNLNYDGVNNATLWRFRRMAKRTVEINRIFKQVFADRPDHIRSVINNARTGFYSDMLDYVTKNYGSPANDIYAIAVTGYYNSADTSSVPAILNGEQAMSNTSNRAVYQQTKSIATYYGLHMFVYEGGEGEVANPQAATPADPDLPAKFAASRDPGMEQVVKNDLLNNWYPAGGDLYMEFSQVSGYSIYGFWGNSEDLNNMSTGKWLGTIDVLNATRPAMTMMTNLPFSSGSSMRIPEALPSGQNYIIPAKQPWLEVIVNALVAGSYSIQVSGVQTQAGQMPLMVDNQLVGNVTLPTSGNSAFSNAVTVNLSAGLHSIFVYPPPGVTSYSQGVTVGAQDTMIVLKN